MGRGVYAAAVGEAQWYAGKHGGDVYLVTPLPNKHAVVGERGWRAEGAVCLKRLTQENQAQIARMIVAAAAKDPPSPGHPQMGHRGRLTGRGKAGLPAWGQLARPLAER